VPDGGRTVVDEDGSARVVDGDGNTVTRITAPWAYDALGRPVDTWYTVSPDGTELVQHIEPDPDAVYPILADPEEIGVCLPPWSAMPGMPLTELTDTNSGAVGTRPIGATTRYFYDSGAAESAHRSISFDSTPPGGLGAWSENLLSDNPMTGSPGISIFGPGGDSTELDFSKQIQLRIVGAHPVAQ